MELRQKIIFLILVAFMPMIIMFSLTSFYFIEKDITNLELGNLNAVATSKKLHVEDSIERNLERLQGVTSRTQLRISVDSYNENFNVEDKQRIEQIIHDAKKSINDFKEIIILDPQGNHIASTNDELNTEFFKNSLVFQNGKSRNFLDIGNGIENEPCLFLSGPLVLNEKIIGVVIILSSPDSITSITSNHSSLGNTGESFLAKQMESGDAVFITPLRFESNAQLNRVIYQNQEEVPIIQALKQNEGTFLDTIDYRGQEVLSATRHIEETNWGLVVKLDKQEAFSSINELKSLTSFTIIVSLCIAAVMSIIFSQRFSKPIETLQEAAKSISKGNFDVDISTRNDELGDLYEDFKKMGKSLKASRKELRTLKEVEESKDNFLSMVTHELRTPLTPIIGWGEALKEPNMLGTINQKQTEAVNSILRSAEKLKNLIGDVLDVQKLEINKLKIRKKKFSVNKMISNIYSEFKESLEEQNTKLSVTSPENLEIISDQERIEQVLGNLISNAKDFVPKKNGEIKIQVKNTEKFVEFSVSDNGIGISEEHQKDLFKKFYQIDTSVTRKHQGSGLGLSICKGIVELLGGKIWVTSQQGEGAIFYFTIAKNQEGEKD